MSTQHTKDKAAREAKLSAVFHALADPTRRSIIELLREAGELRVSDVSEAFAMSLNGVSKHLKVLERAELLHRRIEGRTHWVSVHWSTLEGPFAWLDTYHHYWASRLDALDALISPNPDEESP